MNDIAVVTSVAVAVVRLDTAKEDKMKSQIISKCNAIQYYVLSYHIISCHSVQ